LREKGKKRAPDLRSLSEPSMRDSWGEETREEQELREGGEEGETRGVRGCRWEGRDIANAEDVLVSRRGCVSGEIWR